MRRLTITEGTIRILLASLGGFVLTFLTSMVPIGYSDAEEATIGRITYYGFPVPHGAAPGYSLMENSGRAIEMMPYNLVFWTALLLFLFCIQSRRRYWKLLVATVISHGVFWAVLFILWAV